jgi:hypothetical protein
LCARWRMLIGCSMVDLAATILAEREAHKHLRAARAQLAKLVVEAVDAGISYDELARLSIRATTGHSATIDERRREVDRLRQIARRHRRLLIKRVTIEEVFAAGAGERRADKARSLHSNGS